MLFVRTFRVFFDPPSPLCGRRICKPSPFSALLGAGPFLGPFNPLSLPPSLPPRDLALISLARHAQIV